MKQNDWLKLKKKQKQEKERIESEKIKILVKNVIKENKLPKSEEQKKWYETDGKWWKGFLRVSAVIGFCSLLYVIYVNFIKPDKKKFEDETIYQGDLNPPPISGGQSKTSTEKTYFADNPPNFNYNKINDSLPKITGILINDFDNREKVVVMAGTIAQAIPTAYFYKGIDVFKFPQIKCTNTNLILGVKNNRLYVSVEFKRLQNEETMGMIEFNHWKMYKSNLLEYPQNNDSMLEVRDKQNKIAFSIKYLDKTFYGYPAVSIKGYFIGDSSISILNNAMDPEVDKSENFNCLPKSDVDWKQKASKHISKIFSIFNHPHFI